MSKRLLWCLALTAIALPIMASGRAPAGAAAGGITGAVTFTGTPPKMRPIDMAKEPTCGKQHATPVMNESVVAGTGNTVGNVVVYISAGGAATPAATQTIRYDQRGCEYIPHVAVFQVGQPLEIYNDDQTSHNIHPLAKVNPEWNKSQPPQSAPIKASYDKPEFIPVKCNIHPWMHGYFAVMGTSHYALTGPNGTFRLAGLAPGKYTVTAWHERFGTVTQEVTVPASGNATANLVMKALPY